MSLQDAFKTITACVEKLELENHMHKALIEEMRAKLAELAYMPGGERSLEAALFRAQIAENELEFLRTEKPTRMKIHCLLTIDALRKRNADLEERIAAMLRGPVAISSSDGE